MELSWVNKLRIAAVATLGIVVLGILAWPLAAPEDPLLPVRAANLSLSGTMGLLVLAFALGFAGYFIAWPHGREMGILAVPFGLTIWAVRSGPMRMANQVSLKPDARQTLVHSFRFEPVYWVLIVAAGFAGVLAAQYLGSIFTKPVKDDHTRSHLNVNTWVNHALAILMTVIVSQFFIGVFTRDTVISGVAAQPESGQIVFGVTAAFAVAAFVVKKFLNLSYIWPVVASVFIPALTQPIYYNARVIQQFTDTRPATFFPHTIFAILPIQLVALGTLGAVIGYWLAVRYEYWRRHESAG